MLERIKEFLGFKVGDVIEDREDRRPPPDAVRTLFNTGYGPVFSDVNGNLLPWCTVDGAVWGDLTPLFHIRGAQEIFFAAEKSSSGDGYEVTGVVTIKGRRYPFKALRVDFEDAINRVIQKTGAPLSLRNPIVTVEVDGWRCQLRLPLVAGGRWEVEAAKLLPPPALGSYGPLLAARLLTLSLTRIGTLVTGEPGAGKTTLLNSICVGVWEFYPNLRTVVVERIPEIYVPPHRRGAVSRLIARKDDELGSMIQYAIRFGRPDVLVVGEIRAHNVYFVDVVSPGIPSLTTMHSPNSYVALQKIALHMRRRRVEVTPLDIARSIRGYIEVRKRVGDRIEWGIVDGVSVSDGQKLVYVYRRGQHVSDRVFADLLSPYGTILGRDSGDVYEELKQALGVEGSVAGEPVILPLQ